VKLLCKYKHIVSAGSHDLGKTGIVKHSIETGSEKPIKNGLRRIAFSERQVVRDEIDKMLVNNIIEKSNSPWASPVVLVKKKDGSIRFCIDFRRLNNITKKDAYPLPRIDDTLESLSGAQFFSTLDLASGYWQVEMEEKDKSKTAFVSHMGLFQFKVMPFGLCNAPQTFQRLMEGILAGLNWEECLVYLDDIIIFASTVEEHIKRLELVFQRLEQSGLKIKIEKCKFMATSVNYLGHVVSSEGVRPDSSKTQCIANYQKLENADELRSFLGLASYNRRFIKNFAEIASPLYKSITKDHQFKWTEELSSRFEELKIKLVTAPTLAFPDFQKSFKEDTGL
jgi:hypothetical protein